MVDEKRLKPFKFLREHGLYCRKGLDTRGKMISVTFEAPSRINNDVMSLYHGFSIGMYSYARNGIFQYVSEIGRYCSIGPNVMLGSAEHPTQWLSTSPVQYGNPWSWYPGEDFLAEKRRVRKTSLNSDTANGFVKIGNDVWIGGGATIRRGIVVGDGAIIGGNAYVTRDVEPYSIVLGLPAKHVKYRFDKLLRDRLLQSRWWQYDINDLAGVPFDKVGLALDEIQRRKDMGLIRTCNPPRRIVSLHTKGYCDLRDLEME